MGGGYLALSLDGEMNLVDPLLSGVYTITLI